MSARVRTIKPEITRCRELAGISHAARATFLLLPCFLDDSGYGADDARIIKADLYPLEDYTRDEVDEWLEELTGAGVLCRYKAGDDHYLHVPRFLDNEVPRDLRAPWGQKPQKLQPALFPRCERDHSGPGQGSLFGPSVTGMQPLRNNYGSSRGQVGEKTSPVTSNQIPVTSNQTHMLTPAARATAWEQFWSTYPRREGKRRAQDEFTRALSRATAEQIIGGAARYRDDPNRVARYTKHPSTWLHQDCWLDDPLPEDDNGPPRQAGFGSGDLGRRSSD